MYNQRQNAILTMLGKVSSASREDIQKAISTQFDKSSKITLLRDIDTLMTDGLIIKNGTGHDITYSLATKSPLLYDINVDDYFAIDADKRSLKTPGFNFDIWEGLHNLLSKQEITDLESLNKTYRTNKAKLSPTLLQKELERLTVELAWKSSKIEGNTYTLLDTERLLKENVEAQGKTLEETKMVLNHKKALDFVLQNPSSYKELSVHKIEEIQHLLVDGLNVAKGIRTGTVGIIGTNYKPLDNSYQIKEALERLTNTINNTANPLEKALIAVLMISYIQPFEDGNKRTSRILGNALLTANDYCPLSYRSVDEVEYKKGIILFYEQNNASYFKFLFVDQFKQAISKYFG